MVEIPSAPTTINLKYDQYSLNNIEGKSVYVFYVRCADYVALPTEANVRSTSESAPYKSMCATLVKEPEMFFFKNGGINVIAEDVDLNETKKIAKLSFLKDYGILNGGHTQKAILDTKEQEDIEPGAIVRVEVVKWKIDNEAIAELASAKNSASNVKAFSIANKKGLFNELKAQMSPVYEQRITWFENEPVEGKPMSSLELITILNMFDISRYDKMDQPNASASAPASVFSSWMEANEGGGKRLSNVYPLVNDILDLYEYIQATFNKDIGNGLTKRDIIKRAKKGNKNSTTLFTNRPVDFVLPKQLLMPMLGSMRADLVSNDENDEVLEWKLPPKEVFDSVKKELTTFINNYLKQNDINKLSKDPNAWSSLYNIVRLYISEQSSRSESQAGGSPHPPGRVPDMRVRYAQAGRKHPSGRRPYKGLLGRRPVRHPGEHGPSVPQPSHGVRQRSDRLHAGRDDPSLLSGQRVRWSDGAVRHIVPPQRIHRASQPQVVPQEEVRRQRVRKDVIRYERNTPFARRNPSNVLSQSMHLIDCLFPVPDNSGLFVP